MQYPLTLNFKKIALSPQIFVRDANGEIVCYVKRKMFQLKASVKVFRDPSMSQLLCEIKSDSMLDWSSKYSFFDSNGQYFGHVKRQGTKSIWKASYEVYDETHHHISNIAEENPMAKVMDGCLGQIPLFSLLTAFMFHPKYLLTSAADDSPKMRLTKQASLWESSFVLERMYDFDDVDELRGLMAYLMMSLLERKRG